MAQAFCMKCRRMVDIQNPTRVILSNKSTALTGTCPISGTRVYRFTKRRLDPIYVLELSIKRENEAKEYYLESADRTKEPTGKKMFKWLAKIESQHANQLEQQLRSVLDKNAWRQFKEEEAPIVADEFPNLSEGAGTYDVKAAEVAALRKAIRSEKQAISFYSENQDVTTDPIGKGMFAWLVNQEGGHLLMLERQLDSLTKHNTFFTIRRFLHI